MVQGVYFLAGCLNALRLLGAPAPVSSRLASCHLDGLPLSLRYLPASFQSIVAQIVPSYGGGGNPWANAWSWAPSVYQRVFQAALKAGAAPFPRSFESSPDRVKGSALSSSQLSVGGDMNGGSTRGIGGSGNRTTLVARAWEQFMSRLHIALQRDVRDPWPRQSLNDGACEFLGMRTLVQVRQA